MGAKFDTWVLKDFVRSGFVDSGLSINTEKRNDLQIPGLAKCIQFSLFTYKDSPGYVSKVCTDDPIKVCVVIEFVLKNLHRGFKVVSYEPETITLNRESIVCIKTTLLKKKLFSKVSETITVFFDISDYVTQVVR